MGAVKDICEEISKCITPDGHIEGIEVHPYVLIAFLAGHLNSEWDDLRGEVQKLKEFKDEWERKAKDNG